MNTKLSRRDFLKLSSLGGGLVLAVYLEGCLPGTNVPTATIVPVTPDGSPTPRRLSIGSRIFI